MARARGIGCAHPRRLHDLFALLCTSRQKSGTAGARLHRDGPAACGRAARSTGFPVGTGEGTAHPTERQTATLFQAGVCDTTLANTGSRANLRRAADAGPLRAVPGHHDTRGALNWYEEALW